MDAANLLSLPLPSDYLVSAALVVVVAGVALLGLTFLILFHGNHEEILAGVRLRAAAATFVGGLFLPTIVVAVLLLTPLARPSFASVRPAKEGVSEQEGTGAKAKAVVATTAPATSRPAAPPSAAAEPTADTTPAALAKAAGTAVLPDSNTKAAGATAALAAPDPVAVARGKALVLQQNCLACHRIAGNGGAVGPDLSDVANRRDADWLMRHFKDPQAVSPGTLMPKFHLSDGEFTALTAYMLTLRGGQ